MSTRATMALGLGALLAAASAVLVACREVPPEPPPERPPSALAPGAPRVSFDVLVLAADGSPAAGATVRVFESDRAGGNPMIGPPRELPPERGRGVADADGRVHIDVPGAVWGGFVTAHLGRDAATTAKAVYLKAGASHAAELRLAPSHGLRGRVVNEEGRVVRTASVLLLVPDQLASFSSSSGPYAFAVAPESCVDGVFEFAPLGRLPKLAGEGECALTLRIRADGYPTRDCVVDPDAMRRGPVDVQLVGTDGGPK